MRERLRQLLASPILPLWLALFAFVSGLPSLNMGWQMDDHMLRSNLRGFPGWEDVEGAAPSLFGLSNGQPDLLRDLRDRGLVPWWTLESLRLAFLRPVAEATHRLDESLWPESAALAHVHSLVWWGLLAATVGLAYRRLAGPGWVAGLAAVLWILDDARAIPAGWIANRNALLSTLFGVLAIVVHDRWRREGARSGALVAPALLALGLLSAEAGIGACAALFAYACFLDPCRRVAPKMLTLAPYAVVVVGWRLLYNRLGFGADGSDFYIDPVREPVAFLGAAAQRLPILFQGQWAYPISEMSILVPPALAWGLAALGVATFVVLWRVFRDLLREDPRARFFALSSLLALIPIASVIAGDRNLAFVGFGASGLLALGLERWWNGRVAHTFHRRVLAGLAVWHLVVAVPLHQFMLQSTAQLGNPVHRAAIGVPAEALDPTGDLVLVSAPDFFYSLMIGVIHGLDGRPLPKSIRPLSLGPSPMALRRSDEHTLEAAWEGGMPQGMFAGLFRGRSRPIPQGTVLELEGLRIEVTTLDDGRVARASFRWDRPLESADLHWLQWNGDGFALFTPPPVGATVDVPPAPSPFEATFRVD